MNEPKEIKLKCPIYLNIPFGDTSITINRNSKIEYYVHSDYVRIITKNVQFNMCLEDFEKVI